MRRILPLGARMALLLALASTPGAYASHAAAQNGQALLEALRTADMPLAASFLNQPVDVNARDDMGTTALMWAAQRRSAELTARLLKAGADPNRVSATGGTALQIAITNQAGDVARLLLEHGAHANVATGQGETALMAAAHTGQRDIMEQLIAHGADVNAREKRFGQTALMWAAGYPQEVTLLLAHGANARARTKTWDVTTTIYTPVVQTIGVTGIPWNHDGEYTSKKGGQDAIFFAVQKDDLASVAALLEAGVDVNDQAADGATPLLRALYKWNPRTEGLTEKADFAPNVKIANLLLDHAARVDVADETGYTPLHAATLCLVAPQKVAKDQDQDATRAAPNAPVEAATGLALVKRMLDLKADPNAATRYPTGGPIGAIRLNPVPAGSSPVHIAATSGNADLMALLLDHGGDPNEIRQDGHSPLSIATKTDELDLVTLLVAHGADVQRTYDPNDPIADPNKPIARRRSRQSIMHIAAAGGAYHVIPFLAERGAPLSLENDVNETPLVLADEQEMFRFNLAKESTITFQVAENNNGAPIVRKTDTTDAIKKALQAKTKKLPADTSGDALKPAA